MPLPFALASLQAAFLQFLPTPLLTAGPGRIAQERQRRIGAPPQRKDRTLEGLGIEPVDMAVVVPSYLWRFRKTGQFKVRERA